MNRGGPHFEGAEKVEGSSLARERGGRFLGNFFTLSLLCTEDEEDAWPSFDRRRGETTKH